MKKSIRFLSLLAGTALAAPVANATVLSVVGQVGATDQVVASAAGGVTTITSDTTVDITAIDAPLVTPIVATLALDAHSVSPAITIGGNVAQAYSGTFSITSGTTNYLSGTFVDTFFGGGSAAGLTASSDVAGEVVTFTSNVLPLNAITGPGRGVSFSFTDVTPGVSTVGVGSLRTLAGFRSDISGDFSAATIPESSTWVMLALGFAGLGYAAVRRSAKDRSALAI
jgi:hypothetical protein